MNGLITFQVLSLLSIANSPYPDRFTTIPSMEIEMYPVKSGYVSLLSSARCNPVEWNRWNPITALWGVEVGADVRPLSVGDLRLGIGHVSEHGVNVTRGATESHDYLRVEYKFKF